MAQKTTVDEMAAMVSRHEGIYVVSGEGETGTRELVTGTRSARALKGRLTRERQGGDRWAYLTTESGQYRAE